MAVNTLGQFAEHPRAAALREFITDWYVSYLSVDSARGQPEAGPQERLTRTGDNLANVIQYLAEQHPRPARAHLRGAAPAGAAHRARAGRPHARWPPAAADQGRAVRPPGPGPLRVRRHAEDAGLPDVAVRPGAAAVHRHRGAGELPAPPAAAGAGRGVPRGHERHPAVGHDPFAVLPQRAAPGGGAGALPRRAGLHPGARAERHAGCAPSSWRRARCSATCGWRGSSASATRWSTRARRPGRWQSGADA